MGKLLTGKALVAIVAIVMLLCQPVVAATSDGGSISVTVDKVRLDVGDTVTVEVIYSHDSQWTPLRAPNPVPWFQRWLVESVTGPEVSSRGGQPSEIWRFVLIAEQSGIFTLPQPQWRLSAPGQDQQIITADEVIISVNEPGMLGQQPELLPAMPVVLPPAPSLWQPSSWWWWLIPLPLLAAAVMIWLLLRRRQTVDAIDPLAACQQALSAARQISDARAAGAAIATAMRRYCGIIGQFDGVGSTPRECLQHLRPVLPAMPWSQLRAWFDRLDALRFAPEATSRDAVADLASTADRWLQDEAERQAAAAAAAAAAVDNAGDR